MNSYNPTKAMLFLLLSAAGAYVININFGASTVEWMKNLLHNLVDDNLNKLVQWMQRSATAY
jgi:hypothetical protein